MKKSLNLLPSQWHTSQLLLTDSLIAEAVSLQQVVEACAYVSDYSGINRPTSGCMLNSLRNPRLPPGGFLELHRYQSIRKKLDPHLIGFMFAYHGFPDSSVFWLADLFIHPNFQGKKLGQELIQGLAAEIRRLGHFKSIQLNVHLKNWKAVRFWSSNGFDKIIKCSGDKEYGLQHFASLVLEFKL